MRYRAEIDGLRTVAVLPVVLFHAGFSKFSGGFVGVDIFFVISGFLITGIIADEITAGQFSLLRFYERRARRILPALFSVIFLCWLCAIIWMRPDQIESFATSAIAAIFFTANIYFWRDGTAYFAAASEEQALLHTWSLSVEEQFYILFPLFFLLLWKRGGRTALIGTSFVAAMSFLINLWALSQPWISPSAVFYLLPTRAWELLIGAICAIYVRRFGEKRNQLGAFLGLVAILASIFLYDHNIPSPSAYLIVPVVGTAAILLFANGTVVGAFLSWRPMVGIGLISYSVYLWHQPLFAFARIRLINEPSNAILLGLSALSLLLGWMSWRFVELPFRRAGVRSVSAFGLLAPIAISVVCFSGLFALTIAHDGFPSRFPHFQTWMAEVSAHKSKGELSCSFNRNFRAAAVDDCLDKSEKKILLIGDSHADALSAALLLRLQETEMAAAVVTNHACFPIPGLVREGQHDFATCEQFTEDIWRYIEARKDLTVVIFVRWALYIEGTRFDNTEGGVERSPMGRYIVRGPDGNGNPNQDPLRHISSFLQKEAQRNDLLILSQYPEAGWDLKARVAFQPNVIALGLSTPIAAYEKRNHRVDAMFDQLELGGISVVRLNEMFCDTFAVSRCAIIADKMSFYIDSNHPSPFAAKIIADQIAQEFSPISSGNIPFLEGFHP